MRVRIDADRELCIASGHCARLLPEFFEQSEDSGAVVVVHAQVNSADAALRTRLAEVRESCPVAAIDFAEAGERRRTQHEQ